jgi:integrase
MGQIKQFMFTGGERYPMLVDSDGLPDFWVTLYVTENLRGSLKQTAIENTIRHIIHLMLWEEINGRDLIAEISQEKFLSDADIAAIRDHCLLNTRSLREWQQITQSKNVIKLSINHPTSSPRFQVISKKHAANRLVTIANYLYFTARTLLRQRANFTSLTGAIDDMKKRIIAQKPKGPGNKGLANEPDAKAPSPEVFESLMCVIREDSSDNPYKNLSIRKRNELMFDVLYETGMRSGEILALYIGDVDYQLGNISVVRRHDNPDDPRLRQPVAKTLERNIPISLTLAKKLRDYVMEVRSKVPGANKRPFLFVTHKSGKYQGQPISESSFRNRILGPATSTNSELFGEICRHGFRHNFNYRLSKKIDTHNQKAKIDPSIKPINEKEEIQIRMHLNGWASEESAQTYNLRHTQEMANKLMREEMNDLSKHIKKEK